MQIKSVGSKEIENSIFKIQKHFKLLLILKILVHICITEYNHSDLVHLPTTASLWRFYWPTYCIAQTSHILSCKPSRKITSKIKHFANLLSKRLIRIKPRSMWWVLMYNPKLKHYLFTKNTCICRGIKCPKKTQ